MSSAAEPTQPPASPAEGKRVAVVTGASGGIGTGLVAAFRHAGYSVVATSLSISPSDDHNILAVQSDITEIGPAQRVVKQAVDRFGRIDTLINTAGIFIGKPFTDYTLDDYEAIMAVNLAGFFHITQPVIRQMLTQGNGHIVNITTSLVDHPDSRRPSALASLTKGGLAAGDADEDALVQPVEIGGRGLGLGRGAEGVLACVDVLTTAEAYEDFGAAVAHSS